MAKLTYGIVLAALAALVSGFFVKTSTLPLIASIGLSAVATLLILIGWGRRLRLESEAEVAGPVPQPEVEIEDIDFIELGIGDDDTPPPRRGRRARVRAGQAAAVPTSVEEDELMLPEDAELTFELPEISEEPEPARTRKGLEDLDRVPSNAKRRPAAAKPAAKPKAKPKAKPGASPKSNRVVIVPGRGRYHRSSCRFARRREAKEVTVATARRRGYEPCSVCDPDET
jgi:hypothetical protein